MSATPIVQFHAPKNQGASIKSTLDKINDFVGSISDKDRLDYLFSLDKKWMLYVSHLER